MPDIITNDVDWLDLKLGDEATVKGLLEYAGSDGLTVTFNDWSRLLIDADDANSLQVALDEEIEIVVTRTEDGVFATQDAITDCIVQLGTI